MKRLVLRGAVVGFVLAAAMLTAEASTTNDTFLTFHIPALDEDTDVASAYVTLNWTDSTHTTVPLNTHRVDPDGMLVAEGDLPPTCNHVLASLYAYGNRTNGGAFSRSATAKVLSATHYDLLVGGIAQGAIDIQIEF